MNLKIALIDDDESFFEIFKDAIPSYITIEKLDTFTNVTNEVFTNKYDIVFLDVMLVNKQSFVFAEKFKNFPERKLVFISNFNNFVNDSYKLNTFFFVKKDNLVLDLIDLFNKYKEFVPYKSESILINTKDIEIEVPQYRILYIEVFEHYLHFHLYDEELIEYCSLKNKYAQLNKKYFYKLNASVVINMEHVVACTSDYIEMSNGDHILFTRGSSSKFMKAYMEFKVFVWNQ